MSSPDRWLWLVVWCAGCALCQSAMVRIIKKFWSQAVTWTETMKFFYSASIVLESRLAHIFHSYVQHTKTAEGQGGDFLDKFKA